MVSIILVLHLLHQHCRLPLLVATCLRRSVAGCHMCCVLLLEQLTQKFLSSEVNIFFCVSCCIAKASHCIVFVSLRARYYF